MPAVRWAPWQPGSKTNLSGQWSDAGRQKRSAASEQLRRTAAFGHQHCGTSGHGRAGGRTHQFLRRPGVQGRIAIDRGSLPYNKEALASDEMAAGPPANHGLWNDQAQRTDHRHLQWAHPNWSELWEKFKWDKTILGEETVDEARSRVTTEVDKFLEKTHDDWESLKRFAEAAS